MNRFRLSRRQWARVLAASFLFLLIAAPVRGLAQSSLPPAGHSQVIAQGVDLMPTVPVTWRVTDSTAEPAAEAEFFARTLGFAIATGDPILVTGAGGAMSLLHEGQAAFHPEGASERRSSTTGVDAAYANIELIVADAVDTAESLGASTLAFAGDPFTAPAGNRDLRLVRDVLAPSEEGSFPGSGDAPWLLYVTDGAVEVTAENGDVTELQAGDALQVTGAAQLLAGQNGGAWLAASIGDEVALLSAPETTDETPAPTSDVETGDLAISIGLCGEQDDPPCQPHPEAASLVPSFGVWQTDSAWTVDDAEVSGDGASFLYADLPVATYAFAVSQVGFPPEVTVEGATLDESGTYYQFEVVAGEQTEVTILFHEAEVTETGDLLVRLYDCLQGSDPATDTGACSPTDSPWEVSVGLYHGQHWSLLDAADQGEGAYLFTDLPATELVISWDGSGGEVVHTEGIEQSGLVGPYVTIPANGQQEIALYRIPLEGGDGETGSLLVALHDCPPGDYADDFTACTPAATPWEVTVGIYRGASWSLSTDATDQGDGTFLFTGLPATELVISWESTGNETFETFGIEHSGLVGPYVTIPANGQASVSIFRIAADDAAGAGSLTIQQLDCPYGTDVDTDASPCQLTSDPWEVVVTNGDTGESWSLLDDGAAIDAGAYRLDNLPAGTYEIAVQGNGNWELIHPATVTVEAGADASVVVYSVDLREP